MKVHLYPNFLWATPPPPIPPTGVKTNKENAKARDKKLRTLKKKLRSKYKHTLNCNRQKELKNYIH